MSPDSRRTKSTGNIFDDLGFEHPEEWKTKAELAAHILRVIESRELTQTEAADVLGVAQPEVSNLKRGRLDRFTLDRLFKFLGALDQHLEIAIRPQGKAKTDAHVTVRIAK